MKWAGLAACENAAFGLSDGDSTLLYEQPGGAGGDTALLVADFSRCRWRSLPLPRMLGMGLHIPPAIVMPLQRDNDGAESAHPLFVDALTCTAWLIDPSKMTPLTSHTFP